MDIFDILFSFKGRISRKQFWIGHAVVFVVMFIALLLIYFSNSNLTSEGFYSHVRNLSFMALWPYLAICIKRCHDRDKSGSWVIVSFVPVIGTIWFIFDLGCLEGTIGENPYGKEPDKRIKI